MGKIYQQLSSEERTMIPTQLEMGTRPAAIAVGLNRSASTLSRELRRNGWARPPAHRVPGRPTVAGGYLACAAHQRAQAPSPKWRDRELIDQPDGLLFGAGGHGGSHRG